MLIFDLNTLSRPATATAAPGSVLGLASEQWPGLASAPGPGLVDSSEGVCDQAVRLLQSLFSREDVIKVNHNLLISLFSML